MSHGLRCAAWLYEPDGAGPHPGVVLAHGFGAVRDMGLDAYAQKFTEAGLAVLAFDYRGFGSSEGEPRQIGSIARQLEDIAAALAFLRAHPMVDAARVGLWGTSFGGGHVITTAARDPDVAAVVAQCPFTDGLDSLRRSGPTYGLLLTPLAILDALRRAFGGAPARVPIVGPLGSMAAMHGEGDEAGYMALVPPDAPWTNEINAAFVWRAGFYRPVRCAARVRRPLLVCVCDNDTVVRPETALQVAQRAPQAEVRHYPCGHFGIYVGAMFERAVHDQVEFLAMYLLGSRRARVVSSTP